MRWQESWVDRFYRSRVGWRDGTTEFHELCRAHTAPGARILEVGAGPTNPTSAFLSSLGELHGLDVSDEARDNVHLRTVAIVRNNKYPHPNEAFDVVVSNYVVEHVTDPATHLSEIYRVLRPGGRYVFRTPNLLHYVALASWLTPHRVHVLLANPLRNMPSDSHDPWPTAYAMNTPTAVRRHTGRAGFEIAQLDLVEKEPSYGKYAKPLFLTFMAYERLVNASSRLAPFRANLFVVLRRKPDATS
jgi:SAM-dependent methyltransferase